MEPIVVVHGGTGSPPEWSPECARAARAGHEVLAAGGSALDAVVAAVRLLEDEGRFNAGRGSYLRLDGKTVETDAGLMTSAGEIGAVAALRGIRHPIEAARVVLGTPHLLYAGEGALLLARRAGLEEEEPSPSPRAREKHERVLAMLRERTSQRPAWRDADLARLWNFPGPLPPELTPSDTVGAVARDADGRLAAANSTGGAVPMLLGRVGDSPLPGAGFWAEGGIAVVTTGVGEEIVRRLAARAVADAFRAGGELDAALRAVVASFPEHLSFGAVAVTARDAGHAANREMAVGRAP